MTRVNAAAASSSAEPSSAMADPTALGADKSEKRGLGGGKCLTEGVAVQSLLGEGSTGPDSSPERVGTEEEEGVRGGALGHFRSYGSVRRTWTLQRSSWTA